MDVGGLGVDGRKKITGIGGVVMHTVGVGTSGVDAMVSKIVAAVPEVSCSAPL